METEIHQLTASNYDDSSMNQVTSSNSYNSPGGACSNPSNDFDYANMASSSPSPSNSTFKAEPGFNMELVHMNGRKVLGPPEDWVGPPPNSVCELYVRRIPRDINEHQLLGPFLRFGKIYEIRLPMDFNQTYRGYAYIKYTTEEDAACAMEVLSHYYIAPGRKLEILHSYEKCRLFVTNIPKHLSEHEIEDKLRKIFPTMERIFARPGSSFSHDGNGGQSSDNGVSSTQTTITGNRGHVFVHFPTHMHALEAKKSITPGLVRMWDRDLKVVWANSERDSNISIASNTLFARNVDLTVNKRDIVELLVKYVPRTSFNKISKVRQTAFLDFTTREAAEICLKKLQGATLRGKRLDVEWAKPSEQQSLHRIRETDFDAVLRLKCIANAWHIPIILFGCYYQQQNLQYGVVILRDAMSCVRSIFCIMHTNELADIHSRMCEVVCILIEIIGGFPDYDYVFIVDKDSAHLLGMVTIKLNSVDFLASCGVPSELYFDLNELIDLCAAVVSLAHSNEESILAAYKESFFTRYDHTYLRNWPLIEHRIFGTIMPKYRNKDALKHNLNDTQIVLALCFKVSGTNAAVRPYMPLRACNFDQGFEGLRYVDLKLLPMALTQSRFVVSHILNHVLFGGSHYYHPAQRIMVPPLWISGCSYAESVKQPNFKTTSNRANELEVHNSGNQSEMDLTYPPQTFSHTLSHQTIMSPMVAAPTPPPPAPTMPITGGLQDYVPQHFNMNPIQAIYGYSLPP
ncbi:uncharacterized protein LOC106092425 [Stomoxys calcitrans]|uniref:uncharacterized protein LOC106092425 n=1 Tax=Stomoxys calcitrans TaxID=35570 RepID=UPI0027E27F60|nr:uncharacterized protein LOC106092425 [Stomoxys calcitrans]